MSKKIYLSPICIACIHYDQNSMEHKCKAFPDGIPQEILESKHIHTTPFNGDSGILFESSNPKLKVEDLLDD
tara:strand:+ start:3430 stop:3645 length:216 start_codon:yes stop_codon:yes gene_type:complete